VYVYGSYGIDKSTDGGVTWSHANLGQPPGQGMSVANLAIAPSSPTTLFASVMIGDFRYYKYSLVKSTAGGASWLTARSGEAYLGPIAVDPVAAGTVYVGLGYSRVGRSTDYGNTWTETLLPVSGQIVTLSIDPRTPSVLYAGTDQGVFKSTDSAAHWLRNLAKTGS